VDEIFKLFGYAALCVSPVSLVYAIVAVVRTRSFLFHSFEANGEVIRLERSTDRDRYGYTYAPVFTFTALDGKGYTVTSEVGSSPPSFTEGDTVRVRYEPENPEGARIHTVFQTWGTAILSGFAAVFCLFWGCTVLGLIHFGK
jgi:Protein of unknown function (DUF3592)